MNTKDIIINSNNKYLLRLTYNKENFKEYKVAIRKCLLKKY